MHDILYNGLMPILHDGLEARDLHKQVANQAEPINAAGYGEFFLHVQNAAVAAVTLSITKLFENPHAVYPTRSIPAALELIRANADSWTDLNIGPGIADLKRMGIDTEALSGLTGAEFVRAFTNCLKKACPAPGKTNNDLSKPLSALKVRRNKMVAHNQTVDIATLETATWQDAERLLRFAIDALGAIAIVFLQTAVTDDSGHSMFDSATQRAGLQLNRLLQRAGVGTAI